MLKNYRIGNYIYQYEEGKQPAGAVEVKPETEKKAVEPENKAVKPANKKRKAEKK